MIDCSRVRNIGWSDWSLLEDFELGGALVLVVSYYKGPTELSLAVAQPLHGWGVSGIARLRGWQQGWSSVPEERVFYGRVPADIVEVALAGPRFRSRAGVRPSGVWVALSPGGGTSSASISSTQRGRACDLSTTSTTARSGSGG